MAQHFLLSAASRRLSLVSVAKLTDDEAWALLVSVRFGDQGLQACPACGACRKHSFLKCRQQWRCKDCGHTFSVTSGTTFSNTKLSHKTLLMAMALYVHAAKGFSALQLSRNLDVQYKTAYVLFQKLRSVLWASRDVSPLKGEVEMDGGYCHSYVRPKNKREDRVDRRLRHNLNPFKRSVLVMRQRGEKGAGANRTIVEVIKVENERDVAALSNHYVQRGTTIFADEHPCYAALAAYYPVRQVNHQDQYSADDGTNQNQAESFFSMMRRMMLGQIHKCAPKNLALYVNEIAWRQDRRRIGSEGLFKELLRLCLWSRPSRDFAKYWQGNHPIGDGMWVTP